MCKSENPAVKSRVCRHQAKRRKEKMKTHKIKLLLNLCDDVLSGDKNFEIRENDRGYQKGDRVVFQPYEPSDPFVKHPISDKVYEITYVFSGWGLQNGYVVFGIKEIKK